MKDCKFNNGMTLGSFLDEWLEIVIKDNVRFSTYNSYEGYIRNHIKRFIGNVPLKDLSQIIVQDFVKGLATEKRIGARMVSIIITMLSNALNYAEDYGLIIKNPCKRIKLPQIVEEEVIVFSNEEQTRIENAIVISDEPRMFGFLIMLYTGLRLGEMCALKWENVDLITKCLWVKFSVTRTRNPSGGKPKTISCIAEPKTKKSKRVIALPEFLCEILRERKLIGNSEFVISEPCGTFVNPRTMQKLFKKLLKRANVAPRKLHTSRHTFTVRALEMGADVKTISETLGHTDVMITLNRYAHSLMEQKHKMMTDFDAYYKDKNLL